MYRMAVGGLVAVMLCTVSACGSDDKPASTPTKTATATKAAPPAATATTATTAAPGGIDPGDLGGIVAGTPKDVRWRAPEAPTSWKKLPTEPGTAQWQVRDTACVITLTQPAGLGTGTGTEPTQDQVLDEFAGRAGKSVGTTLKVGARRSSMFPVVSASPDVTSFTKVSRALVSGGNGVLGEIYAYRRGDFALVLTTLCGGGTFDDVNTSDFTPFIRQLAVITEY